jgi:hypothetical protein
LAESYFDRIASLLTTLEALDYIFLEKKTDRKFIILVSNLKEISPRVFS